MSLCCECGVSGEGSSSSSSLVATVARVSILQGMPETVPTGTQESVVSRWLRIVVIMTAVLMPVGTSQAALQQLLMRAC